MTCPNCLRTLALGLDGVRLATSADTVVLPAVEIAKLRRARQSARDGGAAVEADTGKVRG